MYLELLVPGGCTSINPPWKLHAVTNAGESNDSKIGSLEATDR
jgi:hypothetical protein